MKLVIVIVVLLFVTLTEQKSKKSHTASYRLIKTACVKRMKPTTNSPPETREVPFIYNLLNYLEKRSGRRTPGKKVDPVHFAPGKHLSLNTASILAQLIRSLQKTNPEINEQKIQDFHKRLMKMRSATARKRKLNQILRRLTGTARHTVTNPEINKQEMQDLHKQLMMKGRTSARMRKLNQILRRLTGTVRHSVMKDVIASGDPKVGLDFVCSIMIAGLL